LSGLVKKFKEIELHLREIQRILKLSKQQEDTGRMIQKYGRFKGGYHGRRDIPESTGVCEEEAGQFRIGGAPFIVHPIAVAEILRQDGKQVEYRVAAVLHDLLEDTDASEQEIVEIGGEDVLKAVKLVTKEKEYCMETYIAGIKTNSMAYAVKGADRLHNLQSAFCANEKFRKKYIRETLDWYMKFRPEIPEVVAELIESLSDDEEKEKFRAEIEHFVEK
jgi:(p)ppGpp synthase/HD superfamily hydrolase